jgi:putative ABC transport system substrate-binding protein
MNRVWTGFLEAKPKSAFRNLKSAMLLGSMLSALCASAEAQQAPKLWRIGFLASTANRSGIEYFRQALRELGYLEGENVAIEYRPAEGNLDRMPALAAELVRLKVDVIVTTSIPATRAAKNATAVVPIVMQAGDPVAGGLVASLAQPGGNITGTTTLSIDLAGKRLELLKEIIPKVSRVAVLFNPGGGAPLQMKEIETAARGMGMLVQFLEVRTPNPDFHTAFRTAAKGQVGGLIPIRNAIMRNHRHRIADLAAKNRLPAVYPDSDFVEAGGLMSYGPSHAELYRRTALYVDKILKGAKPADLPVEQPKKFEFIINLKAAKQIGLTIPPNVLARADRVIK